MVNNYSIRVGNVYKDEITHYCGRKSSYKPKYGKDLSILGNPFPMTKMSRDEVCDKYEAYLRYDIDMRNKETLDALDLIAKDYLISDVVLGCFCAPQRCHCDTIKQVVIARATYLKTK